MARDSLSIGSDPMSDDFWLEQQDKRVAELEALLDEVLSNYDPESDEQWSLSAWFDDVRTTLDRGNGE